MQNWTSRSKRQQLRYTLTFLIIFLGIGLTTVAWYATRTWGQQGVQTDLEGASENRFAALDQEIQFNLHVVLSLQAFHNHSRSVTRSEFHDYVSVFGAQHPSIQALEWIPRVSDAQREMYEAAARQDGFPNFEITGRDDQGKIVRAAQHDEYFPVYFVEPYQGNEIALGYDLASNQIRREALERARDTGEMIATARITLVQETASQPGFLVFAPVYRRGAPHDSIETRRENLEGFALGVFRVGDILNHAFANLHPDTIDVYLYDTWTPTDEQFLYCYPVDRCNPTPTRLDNARALTIPSDYTKRLNLAGREWLVVFKPTHQFIAASTSWEPWGVLVTGLVFTMLVGSFLLANIHRTARIELLVHQRTMEIAERQHAETALRESEERYRTLAEAAQDAIFVIDHAGTVEYVNSFAAKIYGVQPEELTGKSLAALFPSPFFEHQQAGLQRVLQSPEPVYTEQLAHFPNRQVWLGAWFVPLKDDAGHSRAVLGVARDITARKRIEAENVSRARQQAVAADLGQFALAHGDLTLLMNQIVSQVAQTLDVEYCKILELLPGGEQLILGAGVGWHEGLVGHARMDAGKDSQAGYTLLCNQPVIVEDLATETRFSGPALLKDHRVVSGISVIIYGNGQPFGVLGAHSTRRRQFTEDDAHFLQSVANLLATALRRTQIEQAERDQHALAEALGDAAAALNSTLDFDAVLDRILDNVSRVVPHDAADIMLLEDSVAHIVRCRGYAECGNENALLSLRPRIDDWHSLHRAMETGLPALIPDTVAEPTWVQLPETQWVRSYLGVPIRIKGKVVGFLNLDSNTPGFFTPDHAARLQAFADQAATAMENARLLAELHAALEMTTRIYLLSGQILTVTSFEETARLVTRTVRETLQADSATIRLFDPDGQVHFQFGDGLSSEFYQEAHPRPDGLTIRVWRSGELAIVNDSEQINPRSRAEGIVASMVLPLKGSTRTLGVVFLEYLKPREFSEREVELLSLFANQTALALERIRFFDEVQQRIAELEAVNKISTTLRAAHSLDEMLPLLLDEILNLSETDAGVIWLGDSNNGELRPAVARGWFNQITMNLSRHEGTGAIVIGQGRPLVSREFKHDPTTRETVRAQIPEGWGGACIPIQAVDQIVGALFVSVQLPRELSPAEVHLLTTITEMAGNAIQRTRLHEETRLRLQQLAALHEIDQAITANFDVHLTFDAVLKQVITQLDVDAAAILLLNPHTQSLEYGSGQGFRSKAITRARLRLGEGIAGRAALEHRVIGVSNRSDSLDLSDQSPFLADENFVAFFAVPLIVKGQVKGVLDVFQRRPFEPTAEWLGFLETLAGQAAIALDNAELFSGLQRSNADLVLAYDTTIEGWSRALDLRDKETEGHTQRVTEMTIRLARTMGFSDADLVHIRRGGLLHDIGKMGIPDSILLKHGPLTEDEWAIMRQHPVYAYELLSPIAYLKSALDIPYCHHEKWDGTGYPRGLKGEQIPLAARIFAVVDVWDALLSDRPYRAAWMREQVLDHIRTLSGTHFDPQVVEQFLRLETSVVWLSSERAHV